MNWNQSLSVNVSLFDDHHKKLIDLVNQLIEAMKRGDGNNALGGVLQSLVNYTATHFSSEERLMQSKGYPDYAKHKAIHDSLVKEVMDLQAHHKAGKSLMTIKVMKLLKEWLVSHIQGEDKKYGPFLNSKNVF